MYESYWGMRGRPFEQLCSTDAYYPSEMHQASLLQLRYALDHQRHGLLFGETGVGKSLLLNRLADTFDWQVVSAAVRFTQLPADQWAAALADDLNAAAEAAELSSVPPLNRTLGESLRSIARTVQIAEQANHAVVVFIDDLHLLIDEAGWRLLRSLMDLPFGEQRLTLMLSGQTIVLNQLNRRQDIEQRLGVKSMLRPFSIEQTMAYVRHRLAAVEVNDELFTDTAVERLHVLSAGAPRQLNRLADLCLLVGFADEVEQIEPGQVDAVAQQLLLPHAA